MKLGLGMGIVGGGGVPIPSFLDSSPTAGNTTLTGLEPWNDARQGFMWVRFKPTSLATMTGSDYLIHLNTGSASPSIGIRIDNATKYLRTGIRNNAGNLSTIAMIPSSDLLVGAHQTIGLKWDLDAGTVDILDWGNKASDTFTTGTFTTAFTDLDVGSRNGGSDAFDGTIEALEIGKGIITDAALRQRMTGSQSIVIDVNGQSLGDNLFTSADTGGSFGIDAMRVAGSTLYDKEIIMINAAEGGTPLVRSNQSGSENPWWNDTTDVADTALINAIATAQGSPKPIDWVLWSQGEADSNDLNQTGKITSAEYKTYLGKVFDYLSANLGSPKIGIQKIGRREGAFTSAAGVQGVRQAQIDLVNERDDCYFLSETYDLENHDTVHITDADQTVSGNRNIRALASTDGMTVTGSAFGMQIVSAVRTGTSVLVTFAHDGGTDFTPSTSIIGLRFFDNGSEINITAAVRTSATTATLTLATLPTGVQELFSGYDHMDDISNANLANVLRDNSPQALPLRAGSINIT